MSSVMAMEEYPSIPETIFGWTPLVRRSVAQVCLRSWKRVFGVTPRPASVRVAPAPVLAGLEGGGYGMTAHP